MHHTHTILALRHLAVRGRRRGFNFAEVLFAVMILAIGFIMTAAIFPVALYQTRTTGEEVVASTVGRGGVNYFQQVGLTANALPATDLMAAAPNGPRANPLPPGFTAPPAFAIPAGAPDNVARFPGKVLSFRDNRLTPVVRDALWNKVVGNLILPDDPRVAWVGMYRRGMTYTNTNGTPAAPGDPGVTESPDPYATVIVIGVTIRNRSTYEAAKDLYRFPVNAPPAAASLTPGTLEPTVVYVKTAEGLSNSDLLTFYDATGTTRIDPDIAAEGAYIVISDDQLTDYGTTTVQELPGFLNGHIYRLGARRQDLGVGTWELALDGDLAFIDPDGTPGNADDISENIPARSAATVTANPGGTPAVAFIVGRGFADPLAPGAHEGLAQDTGVYVSIVPAN
jgi:hypothetical protein